MKEPLTTEQRSKASAAEAKSAMWLNRGREQEERGRKTEAAKSYEKAQLWLDRANELRGNL